MSLAADGPLIQVSAQPERGAAGRSLRAPARWGTSACSGGRRRLGEVSVEAGTGKVLLSVPAIQPDDDGAGQVTHAVGRRSDCRCRCRRRHQAGSNSRLLADPTPQGTQPLAQLAGALTANSGYQALQPSYLRGTAGSHTSAAGQRARRKPGSRRSDGRARCLHTDRRV